MVPDDKENEDTIHPCAGTEDATTIFDDSPPRGISEYANDVIGPYTLIEKLGEGGMGTVWLAEQHKPIHRKVALKVVKAGMDSKEVLARFEAERQALAMMSHAGIAKVLDAGATPMGRPYFAMELVDGVPITQFCREHELDMRQRLKLFKEVCSAVNHAHQKGIIHRDLKPSNVLVTAVEGTFIPKVIDFGIAKATGDRLTEQTLFTRLEQILGTPAYMSPEQAESGNLDIDTRSDIYSLGVMLYELLTGHLPFESRTLLAAGFEGMRRILREDEPLRPSAKVSGIAAEEGKPVTQSTGLHWNKLSRILRGDLDWIVMKAIEKDRSRRYETANAFAADIGRYLTGDPVEAAAPTTGYRLKKFARRNKTALAVAATIAVVLLSATVFSTRQAMNATAARRQSDKDREEAVVAQMQERKARVKAEGVSKFLVEMFMSPRPGEKLGGREVKVADVIDRAAKSLETMLTDEPALQMILKGTLAKTYDALGLYSEAVKLQEEVRDFLVANTSLDDEATLSDLHNLAVYYDSAGQKDSALKIREQLLPLRVKVNGPRHPDTIKAMHNLSKSYWELDRRVEGLELLERAISIGEEVLGANHQETLMSRANLATYYSYFDRLDEAMEIEEPLLETLREKLGPEHLDTLVVMHNLAATYKRAGRWEDALELQEPVLESRRTILGPKHSLTLSSMRNLAIFYDGVGRQREGLDLMEKTLALHKEALGPEHPEIPPVACNLTDFYRSAGRLEEALKLGKENLELSRRVFGEAHAETLTAMETLGKVYEAAGEGGQSLILQEAMVALCRRTRGIKDTTTLKAMGRLGNLYQAAERFDESLTLREETLELLTETLGPEHEETLAARTNLAGSYWLTGHRQKAVQLQESTLEIKRRVLRPDHPFLTVAFQALAHFHRETGRAEEAAGLWSELVELRRRYAGPEHPATLEAIVQSGAHYQAAGLPDKALELKQEALDLSRKVYGPDHSQTAAAARTLGFAYDAGGQAEKAIEAWRDAVRIQPGMYEIQYWLGKALADRKRYQEALIPLQAAHELIPESRPEHRENLGRLNEALKALGREIVAEELETRTPTLIGLWIDMNGGSIRIEQNGVEVTATGENEAVTKYWTKGVGRLEKRTIRMTHYLNQRQTATEQGKVSPDESRIDWSNGTHWKSRAR